LWRRLVEWTAQLAPPSGSDQTPLSPLPTLPNNLCRGALRVGEFIDENVADPGIPDEFGLVGRQDTRGASQDQVRMSVPQDGAHLSRQSQLQCRNPANPSPNIGSAPFRRRDPARVSPGFPLVLDARAQTRTADNGRYLRGLVEQVLFTRPGERVMRPDFGSGVDGLVFGPAGGEMAQVRWRRPPARCPSSTRSLECRPSGRLLRRVGAGPVTAEIRTSRDPNLGGDLNAPPRGPKHDRGSPPALPARSRRWWRWITR